MRRGNLIEGNPTSKRTPLKPNRIHGAHSPIAVPLMAYGPSEGPHAQGVDKRFFYFNPSPSPSKRIRVLELAR